MPREAMPMDEKKLTTKALEALTSDHIEYRLQFRSHGTE